MWEALHFIVKFNKSYVMGMTVWCGVAGMWRGPDVPFWSAGFYPHVVIVSTAGWNTWASGSCATSCIFWQLWLLSYCPLQCV